MPTPDKTSVAVIGTGIVGLCVAYSLRKAGFKVTAIDPEPPGSQCSFGNAGALSAGSVAPLAMPGIMKSSISMLLDPTGPLYVPVQNWLPAAPWLLRFLASARPGRVRHAADALAFLLADSVDHHERLAAEIGCPELVRRTGQLHLYPDPTALSRDDASWALKASHGVRIEKIVGNEIRELEPAIADHYQSALFLPDEGWLANPYRYSRTLANTLQTMGVSFVSARVTALRPQSGNWTISDGQRHWNSDHVVVAAGMGSKTLLARLGLHVPLESQRGYHVQIPNPGLSLSRVVVLADRKVFMTPMEEGLRIAGTVELAGLNRPPSKKRALLLKAHAVRGLDGLETKEVSIWAGHRPCLPDSLPVLGPAAGFPGLWCAFGHGHLGVTGSVNTGRLLARALTGQADTDELADFSIKRF